MYSAITTGSFGMAIFNDTGDINTIIIQKVLFYTLIPQVGFYYYTYYKWNKLQSTHCLCVFAHAGKWYHRRTIYRPWHDSYIPHRSDNTTVDWGYHCKTIDKIIAVRVRKELIAIKHIATQIFLILFLYGNILNLFYQ